MLKIPRYPIPIIVLVVALATLLFPAGVLAQGQDPGAPGTITPDLLALIAGSALSLFFSLVPKFSEKFAALPSEYKRLIMIGLMAVVAVGAYSLSCTSWLTGIFEFSVTCDQTGRQLIIKSFILAVAANQSTYSITPLPKSVRKAAEKVEKREELLP